MTYGLASMAAKAGRMKKCFPTSVSLKTGDKLCGYSSLGHLTHFGDCRVIESWNTTTKLDEKYHGVGGPLVTSDIQAPNTIATSENHLYPRDNIADMLYQQYLHCCGSECRNTLQSRLQWRKSARCQSCSAHDR